MNSKATIGYLVLSGILLLVIGVSILVVPDAFFAGSGIVIGDDPSLRSEIRALGGLLAAAALIIINSTFKRSLRVAGMGLSILVYGSFGLARLLGILFDGMPSAGIIGATAIELIFAAVGMVLYVRCARNVLETGSSGITAHTMQS